MTCVSEAFMNSWDFRSGIHIILDMKFFSMFHCYSEKFKCQFSWNYNHFILDFVNLIKVGCLAPQSILIEISNLIIKVAIEDNIVKVEYIHSRSSRKSTNIQFFFSLLQSLVSQCYICNFQWVNPTQEHTSHTIIFNGYLNINNKLIIFKLNNTFLSSLF